MYNFSLFLISVFGLLLIFISIKKDNFSILSLLLNFCENINLSSSNFLKLLLSFIDNLGFIFVQIFNLL